MNLLGKLFQTLWEAPRLGCPMLVQTALIQNLGSEPLPSPVKVRWGSSSQVDEPHSCAGVGLIVLQGRARRIGFPMLSVVRATRLQRWREVPSGNRLVPRLPYVSRQPLPFPSQSCFCGQRSSLAPVSPSENHGVSTVGREEFILSPTLQGPGSPMGPLPSAMTVHQGS